MCRLDVKKSYFGGAHKHIIVKKFGLNDNVATEMKELLVIVIIEKEGIVLLYLRTLAGIICDSGAASMSDCQVLVLFGIT